MVALALDSHSMVDLSTARQVEQALQAYDLKTFAGVTAQSTAGTVILRGSVGSFYARSLAYQLALRQPAVQQVIDSIEVTSELARMR